MNRSIPHLLTYLLIAIIAAGAVVQPSCAASPYKTQNVIIAVMDGTHYARTFGDPTHQLIPHLWNDLRPQGVYYSRFYNNSVTITMAGHSNIMTGTWQYGRNRGPIPTRPTVIHYMLDELALLPSEAHVIFGKGFYAWNPETSFPAYRNAFKVPFDNGIGEETYQGDYDVLHRALQVMKTDHPRLMLINFGVTDHSAHSGDWEVHIGAVKNNDQVLFDLWNAIQADERYKNKTTLIITNDHGYMDEGYHDGFAEHGDTSEGSRHVMLLLLGPDIKAGKVVATPAYHIDIAPTVGELLGFQTPLAQGVPLAEAFVSFKHQNLNEPRTERAKRAVAAEQLARQDVEALLARRLLDRHTGGPKEMRPSAESALALWGLLSAYDKVGDANYLGFVGKWVKTWESAAGQVDPYTGLVVSELAYRTQDPLQRAQLADSARQAAISVLDRFGASAKSLELGNKELLLSLILGASAAEIAHDKALWLRTAEIYTEHVRNLDYLANRKALTSLSASHGETPGYQPEGEAVLAGKVLPSSEYRSAGPTEAWYLFTAAFIRSHGMPFKGENLPDVPFFAPEVLYRATLMLEQLSAPGDLWNSPLDNGLAVAAIQEARRRVTRGGLFENVESLPYAELNELRPLSAENMPPLSRVQEMIRKRVTQMNYNVDYGFPRYQDFDYSVDLLRLRLDEASDDQLIGLYLLALDPHRRIMTEPFVASPRTESAPRK
jgi:hypothetical protein